MKTQMLQELEQEELSKTRNLKKTNKEGLMLGVRTLEAETIEKDMMAWIHQVKKNFKAQNKKKSQAQEEKSHHKKKLRVNLKTDAQLKMNLILIWQTKMLLSQQTIKSRKEMKISN